VLSADLRHLVAAAARDAGYPGHERDIGLRDGGAPGRYSSSLPLRLAPARAEAARPAPAEAARPAPADVAATMAAHLRRIPWIEDAQPTGPGYLTITVTPDKLTETAVLVAEAGPASARSDALAGTSHPAPPEAHLTSARSWAEARDLVAAQVTARLAAAAGATVTVHDSAKRTSATLGPCAGTIPPPGIAERTSATLAPCAATIPPPGTAERTSATLGPPATAGPVPEAVAFAGADAITYALARIPPEHPVALDPAAWARHVPANPAYAVRYAHSCAASTLRWAAALDLSRGEAAVVRPGSLAHPRERALLAALSWLPEQVARAARRGRPHEFAAFLEELAETYQVCRVACPAWPERGHDGARPDGTHRSELPGDARTVRARLWLAGAVAAGLAAGLELLGVGAPDRL
jgi:arginyl-tRNA synthetase